MNCLQAACWVQCGRNFTECESKREIKGQMTVVLRTVSLVLFAVQKEVIEKREETEAKQNRVQIR